MFGGMTSESAERLKAARIKAGFATAKAAAESRGWKAAGYTHHENGQRPYFDTSSLMRYARAFKVSPAWLAGLDSEMTDAIDAISAESYSEVMTGILQAFAPTVRLGTSDITKLGQALHDTLREILSDAGTGQDASRVGLVARTVARTIARQN